MIEENTVYVTNYPSIYNNDISNHRERDKPQ